jgi:hypoxanthine phosphoribosyltransferase
MPEPIITIKDKQFIPRIGSTAIQQRVAELADAINRDYAGTTPLVVGVLTGASLFATDLFRRMHHPCELTFIRVASYHGGLTSSGNISTVFGLKEQIGNRHVLIVEDIIDSGETARHLVEELKSHGPASVKFATLLFKPGSLRYPIVPDYIGFEVGPEFLVGYGLDYDGLGRNFNDIYILKP